MKNLYYYAVASLPPLTLGLKPEQSYEMVRDTLSLNLSPKDWRQVKLFQLPIDLRNIRALWLKQPLDPKGNLGEKELEEALLVHGSLPDFVFDFMDRYEESSLRLRNFASLYASLYAELAGELTGFLKGYYELERQVRLTLTLLRAKAYGRDLTLELQFEDPQEPFVAQLLAQKESESVVLPQEVEELKPLFLDNRGDPKSLMRAILQFRLNRIEEMEADRPFSMDQVLGYLARLAIVEEWASLDEDQGHAALQQLCR